MKLFFLLVCIGLALLLTACSEDAPTNPGDGEFPSPTGVIELSVAGETLDLWPWTGSGFAGEPVDPVNLVFIGQASPVQIRAALLALSGTRGGDLLPDAEWTEAVGGMQTTWTETVGWSASAIQLQAGTYDSLRVHLRLFPAGQLEDGRWVTVGGAHLEVLRPSTFDHIVVSWELAEQFVMDDLVRSGLLAGAPQATPVINGAPEYRSISVDDLERLPPEIVALIGGPFEIDGPVPIPNDGQARVLDIGTAPNVTSGVWEVALQVELRAVLPNPVCSRGPFDWVQIEGIVSLERTGAVDESGRYTFLSTASSELTVWAFDPSANPPGPVGESYTGDIYQSQNGFSKNLEFEVRTEDAAATDRGLGEEGMITITFIRSDGRHEVFTSSECPPGDS